MAKPDPLYSYRVLIDETLQPLHARKLTELADVNADVDQHEQLQLELDAMAASRKASLTAPVKMLTDIGCGYRMQARVESGDTLCIRVGAISRGRPEEQCFLLEMSLEEARAFVGRRLSHLRRLAKLAEEECVRVAADLRSAQIAVSALSQGAGT